MKYKEIPDHDHPKIATHVIEIQTDITAALNAHIADYSDPHRNFTGLTANYIPKKSGVGLVDSIMSDDGTTAFVAGHIDIANGKYIYMDSDALIKYWSGNNAIAFGKNAGADKLYGVYFGFSCGQYQTGDYFSGQGYVCGQYQTGGYFSGQGYFCGQFQTGDYFSGQGYYCGYNQTGDYFSGQGISCGQFQTGGYFSGQGRYCGRNQTGARFSGQGSFCGQYQTGDYFSGQGYACGQHQTGDYVFGGGYYTLKYNDADYATALGSESFNNFNEDTANEKTFDFGDIDVANDRITIVAHGFGAVDSYRNLKFTQGTDVVPGVTTGTIHQFKIISADIVEIITDTITGQGTGTGHKLTPQFVYTESTAVGYDSQPDAAYQIMLGSTNTTWIKTHGSFRAESGVLCLKEITTPSAITDYGKIYTKNDNKLYFQDGAGVEHEVAFV